MKDVLKFFKETIENTAIATVKVLKEHTYSVFILNNGIKINNFPKEQKIKGAVQITNYPNIKREIDKLTKEIGSVKKAVENVKYPTEIIVKNIKDTPVPETYSKVTVENPVNEVSVKDLKNIENRLLELNKAINKLPTSYPAFPKIPEIKIPRFPEEMRISNFPKVRESEDIRTTDPKKYVPVRLTDGKKFYEAIQEVIAGASSNYSFRRSDGTKVRATVNDNDVIQVEVINPTESTLQIYDPTVEYQIADEDTAGTTKYFGFTKADGAWYILKQDTTAGTYRYVKGTADYDFAGRTSLTYDYFHNIF